MMARHRGEHHHRAIWQPNRTGPIQKPTRAVSQDTEAAEYAAARAMLDLASGATPNFATRRSRVRQRTWGKAPALLLAGLAGFAAHQLITHTPKPNPLPATPKQWVSAYEAAAIDNPQRVCTKLFTPQLTAAYAAAAHRSCTSYFTRIRASSMQVRRILHQGDTAIVELHQTIEHTNWNVVLARHDTGWKAVDVVPGQPLL